MSMLEATILHYEGAIRMGAFVVIFAVMALWEVWAPRRALTVTRLRRWGSNLSVVLIYSLLLRLLFPFLALGMALHVHAAGWGLFNQYSLPPWLAIVLSVIVLDFIIYLQHVMFHAIPTLWRLHRVHHADLDFDVTTGVRFHPIEILLSMLIKFMAIILIGPPLAAVVIFEVLLNVTSMFNHSNVRMPLTMDRILRWLIVTPDMHRVHHSTEDHETNSNFGFNLPWWDRLLGTYKPQPDAGHTGMTIGLRGLRDPRWAVNLLGMLWLPFMGRITDYAINRRSWNGIDDKR